MVRVIIQNDRHEVVSFDVFDTFNREGEPTPQLLNFVHYAVGHLHRHKGDKVVIFNVEEG